MSQIDALYLEATRGMSDIDIIRAKEKLRNTERGRIIKGRCNNCSNVASKCICFMHCYGCGNDFEEFGYPALWVCCAERDFRNSNGEKIPMGVVNGTIMYEDEDIEEESSRSSESGSEGSLADFIDDSNAKPLVIRTKEELEVIEDLPLTVATHGVIFMGEVKKREPVVIDLTNE